MKTPYKVFKYTSRNTGYYVLESMSLAHSRKTAIELSKIEAHKTNLEGDSGYFEQYENGEKTSWSA